MPIDETDKIAFQKLKDLYGDQIEKYDYEVYKKPYLSKEPKGAFCTGIIRYKKYYKVSHVVLKDGRKIPVGNGIGCLPNILMIIVMIIVMSLLIV